MAIEPSAALAEPCLCSSYLHLLDTLLHPSDWHLFFAPQIANGGYFLCFSPPATTWLKVKMWRKTIFLHRGDWKGSTCHPIWLILVAPPQFQPIWHMAGNRQRLRRQKFKQKLYMASNREKLSRLKKGSMLQNIIWQYAAWTHSCWP